jgi:hypothetical protein
LFTKLAFVTCAFYLGLNVLLETAVFGLALWRDGAGIHFSSRTAYFRQGSKIGNPRTKAAIKSAPDR